MTQRAKPASRAVATPKSGARPRTRAPSPGVDHRLDEALEQQKATAEILRVISGARSNVKPVFETIAAAALRLCKAVSTNVFTFDGQLIHLAAYVNTNPAYGDELLRLFPRPPSRDLAVTRLMLTGRIIQIPDVNEDPEYMKGTHSRIGGFRSNLAVPLLHDGRPIGAVVVGRPEPGLFPDSQVRLLETFADQAVIAIENARLFTELEARNGELTEALEQQMATSEILRVISQSPTDVQPVFDTIAAAALKLCNASSANVFTYDGTLVHLAALVNLTPAGADAIRKLWPRPLSRQLAACRAIMTCSVVEISDVELDADFAPTAAAAVAGNFRSILSVPLMREGNPIGAIAVGRPEAGAFPENQVTLLRTFADQAVIAIENVRLFNELGARNRELTSALERETATGDVLKVISRSAFDLQPVLDTVIETAARLCGAEHGHVYRFDGELLRFAAGSGTHPEMFDYLREHPIQLGPGSISGLAGETREVVHWHDVLAQQGYQRGEAQRRGGYRTLLAVPMLRGDELKGVIVMWKTRVDPFADKQIELVRTFADQAVIAIENVRLFNELETRNRDLAETLEQQMATSEILRVISRSPTNVQPVFDTIAAAGMKLCGGSFATVVRFERGLVDIVALASSWKPEEADAIRRLYPRPPNRETVASRAVLTCSVANIPDVQQDPDYAIRDVARSAGYRSAVAVPLMLNGEPIGAIGVGRSEVGLFPEKQVTLLQTFADQAVIAIENVRLFTELEARNRDLAEALDQRTATAEILQVISRSHTDLRPVFDTIVRNAGRICGAFFANGFLYDGEQLHFIATSNTEPDFLKRLQTLYPMRPDVSQVSGRVILRKSAVVMEDALADPDYARPIAVTGRWRRMLGVPMLREGKPVGVIVVGWVDAGPVPKVYQELLKTFADQAVIAIENVRLFTELEARTKDLTRSVGELRALGEVGRAVSSTLDLETVLSTIVSRSTELAGLDGGSMWEYDDTREEFNLHATNRLPDELVDVLRAAPIRKGEGVLGRLAITHEPVTVPDIAAEPTYPQRLREVVIRHGYRSVLAVPLLRENQLLGALAVNRSNPGGFDPEVVELLKTFATQSALAIQNARLFREIEHKSRELETASRHKSEFLANMSHELRTPLNAIIGFSEVLLEQMFGAVNDKQTEYLRDILESGQHLLSLINDILDLSKIEAGRMELEASEFDLPGTIENALILVRERASRHGIDLKHEVDQRLGSIRADQRKVKQVLLNLLTNALKFTPDGGRVEVRARAVGGCAEISVADTGIGIAPEDQATVFEEFRQVGTAAKKVEGTGLGLAISRKFIELHGGRIWVSSQVGGGSTFAFTLPLDERG